MKRVIGLDFDDVLMDFHTVLHQHCNPLYNTNISRDKVHTFDLIELWGCSREETNERLISFYTSDAHHNSLPISGSQRAIKELAKDNTMIVVTSRPEFTKEQTTAWIKKNFDNDIEEVHFTNHFMGTGTKKTKLQVCEELGIEIFVDDNPDYVIDIAGSGRSVLLFDTPWNQGDYHQNITRVKSWDHILEVLGATA